MKLLLFTLFCLSMTTTTKAQNNDAWTEYMTPNEVHKLLGDYMGEFNLEISMWMKEGSDPTIVHVSSFHTMILGDRFLEITQVGAMMGTEYQSITTLGFNTTNKTFSLFTLTSMGTGTLYLNGTWDSEKRTANLTGQMTNPMDGKTISVRQQITFIDENQLLIENFDTYVGGKEKKTVQYKFTRK